MRVRLCVFHRGRHHEGRELFRQIQGSDALVPVPLGTLPPLGRFRVRDSLHQSRVKLADVQAELDARLSGMISE